MSEVATDARPEVETHSDRMLGWLLLVCGAVGLGAAAVLLVEKFQLLTDSGYEPSCNLSPILNCGSVMVTAQSEVFGFPNPIIGVAAFPVLVTTGVVLLGRVQLPGYFWWGLQAGVTFGIALVGWLALQSLYRIGALCPYCLVVWAVTIPVFWYVTAANLARGLCGGPVARSRLTRFLVTWSAPIVLASYLLVVVLAGIRFWDYWRTLW
ncbi:MAG: vitamin K epoxide reductase family protein [Propionibacteriaceae bacterium]